MDNVEKRQLNVIVLYRGYSRVGTIGEHNEVMEEERRPAIRVKRISLTGAVVGIQVNRVFVGMCADFDGNALHAWMNPTGL